MLLLIFFQSSPEDMLIDWRERDVRNIDQLPPVCTLTRDQTYNLGMCSATFWCMG